MSKFINYDLSTLAQSSPTTLGSTVDTTLVLETSAAAIPGNPITATLKAYPPLATAEDIKLESITDQSTFIASSFTEITPGVYQASITVESGSGDLEFIAKDNKGNSSNGSVVNTISPPLSANSSNLDKQTLSALNQTSAMADTAEPTRAKSGTYQQALKKRGKSEPTSRSTETQKGRVPGAVETAVAGYRSLSETLAANHKYDEFSKLRLWANLTKPKSYRIKRLNDYRKALDECMERLAIVMQNYDIVEVGSAAKDHTNAENSNALSFRFNAGTFFDVYAPASVFNTEYLIQYSSRATFRQTALDQLSSFYTWHRAQNNMVHQARDYFNYSTQHSFLGGNINTTVYRDKKERYEYLVTQIGQVQGGAKTEGKLRTASKKTAEFNGQTAQLPDMGGSGASGGGGFSVDGVSGTASDTTLPTGSSAADAAGAQKGSAAGPAEDVEKEKISNWDISVKNDYNLKSVVGGIIQKAKDLFYQQAKAIVLRAAESFYVDSEKHVCIESGGDLYLKAKGTLYINAGDMVIRTVNGNIRRLVGYAGIQDYIDRNGINIAKKDNGDPIFDTDGNFVTQQGSEFIPVRMPAPKIGTITEFIRPTSSIHVPSPKLIEGDNSLFTDFLKDVGLEQITSLGGLLDTSGLTGALGDGILNTFGSGDIGNFIKDVATSGLEQMLDQGLDLIPGAGDAVDVANDVADQLNAFVDELIEVKTSSVEVTGSDLSYTVTYKLPDEPGTALITYPTELLDYPKTAVPKPAKTGSNDLRNMPILPSARLEPLWQNGVPFEEQTPTE
jgi:hypothetical protein